MDGLSRPHGNSELLSILQQKANQNYPWPRFIHNASLNGPLVLLSELNTALYIDGDDVNNTTSDSDSFLKVDGSSIISSVAPNITRIQYALNTVQSNRQIVLMFKFERFYYEGISLTFTHPNYPDIGWRFAIAGKWGINSYPYGIEYVPSILNSGTVVQQNMFFAKHEDLSSDGLDNWEASAGGGPTHYGGARSLNFGLNNGEVYHKFDKVALCFTNHTDGWTLNQVELFGLQYSYDNTDIIMSDYSNSIVNDTHVRIPTNFFNECFLQGTGNIRLQTKASNSSDYLYRNISCGLTGFICLYTTPWISP